MARVKCDVDYEELEGDYGPIDGVIVTCSQCDHCEESFGTSSASIRRCLVLMRENCPEGESNFYVAEDDND